MSVNRADTLQRRGLYPVPPGVTQVLGLECAGHVTEVGRHVTRVSKGEAMMALLSGGGYAEHVSVHCGHVMRVPRGLSMDQAAAIPEVTGHLFTTHLLIRKIVPRSGSPLTSCSTQSRGSRLVTGSWFTLGAVESGPPQCSWSGWLEHNHL